MRRRDFKEITVLPFAAELKINPMPKLFSKFYFKRTKMLSF